MFRFRQFLTGRSPIELFAGTMLLAGGLFAATPAGDSSDGIRSRVLEVKSDRQAGFTSLAPAVTGVTFVNTLPESRHLTNQILLNGSGVAAGDVDGDGWCDLYFACASGANALYRNLGGWRFERVAGAGGAAATDLTSTGAVLADLDGDGDLDLILNTLGNGTWVYVNDGTGRFTPRGPVLNPRQGGMTAALADVDGDGFLDLYVSNYRTSGLMDLPNARATFARVNGQLTIETVNGQPLTTPGLTNRFTMGPGGALEELGEADQFHRSVGGTNFVLVPFTEGAFVDEDGRPFEKALFEWGLTATFRDANDDGLPDLYVANDFHSPDRFWLNQGGGRFRLVPRVAVRKSSLFSMAVDFADVNRDGFLDFFTLDMMSRDHAQRMRYLGDRNPPVMRPGVYDDRPQYGLNGLFVNQGDGTYAELAQLAGVEAAEWAWSCAFLDVDLDGWPDLLTVNGMERAARDMDVTEHLRQLRATRRLSDLEVFRERRAFPRLTTANLAFRNRGDLTFEEVSAAWGFDGRGVSQALALADLDNDGDLDVVVNNLNAAPFLLRNESPAPRVAVRLQGLPPNTHGIGARLRVTGGAVPLQTEEILAGGRYLSGDEALRSFAAGTETNRLRVEVLWRSGRRSVVEAVPANRLLVIDEAGAKPVEQAPDKPRIPIWFEDVSARLGHRHHEEAFDDFARQPLLPNKLSQLGPGLAWFDVNGDGLEDLLIGSGKGGHLGVFTNDGAGGFRGFTNPASRPAVTRDQTTVLGWWAAPGQPVLLVGSANYEDGLAMGPAVQAYDLAGGSIAEAVVASESSSGPMALADLDGDGDLDLFVGGRVIGAKYPQAASSRVFRHHAGRFSLDAENTKALASVGLVSGAVFSDLDDDGDPDLVLACEWGPLRIFRNDRGRLSAWDAPLRGPENRASSAPPALLSQLSGWWNSVAAGDFDGDGRLDLVAGNWGRNSKYQAHRSQPLRIYHGNLAEADHVDVVEAHFDVALRRWVPERQLDVLAQSLSFLRGRFPTHRSFSMASIEEVLGNTLKSAEVVSANWLETSVLLNRGEAFEVRPLPDEAQVSPVFGLGVGDFDGDGAEDLFLAQNFFGAQPETARYDAGRGLILKGDGRGGFRAVPGHESGVGIYGEQRGAAVADYDADGRLDLAVAQNGAETRLFRNRQARPGLRVRLEGGPGNPSGIGARVRVRGGTRWGPAKEIRAGAGYWSQDSATLVFGLPSTAAEVEIRWPGRPADRVAVPEGAAELVLRASESARTPPSPDTGDR